MAKKIFLKALSGMMAAALSLSVLTISAKAETAELTGKTAMEITQMMGKGWNLGNTFDADGGNRSDVYSQEQSWGNPKVTKELIDGVKAAGFDTIRIPITWYKHADENNNYKIDEDFMARITEVVNYAYDNDMFVIINMHHEAWLNEENIDKDYEAIGKELTAIWSQIADNFADYDEHLIFEGMNEPRAKGTSYEWSGTQSCYDAVNYLDQLFVETIRNNGKGYNGERALMIPGYAASNSANVLQSIKIPEINGKQAENIIISVHCYSPYDFCLTDNQTTFSTKNSGDTADIKRMLSDLKSLFIDKGISAVIGECGATNSGNNLDARIEWFKYFGQVTSDAGIPAVVWDNGNDGNSGGECHNYFNRSTGEQKYPELISAFIYGDVESEAGDLTIDFEPYKDGGNTVMVTPHDVGFTSAKLSCVSKINHTEGAALGFSMAVDSNSDNAAYLDISKYAGKTVKISAWVKADAPETVEMGIDGTENKISGDVTEEWSCATIYTEVPSSGEANVSFKCTTKMYVDDISIEIVDAIGDNSFESAGTTENDDSEITVSKEDTSKDTEAVTESSESISDPATEDSASSVKPGVIVAIAAAIVAVAGAMVIIIKKKK